MINYFEISFISDKAEAILLSNKEAKHKQW